MQGSLEVRYAINSFLSLNEMLSHANFQSTLDEQEKDSIKI